MNELPSNCCRGATPSTTSMTRSASHRTTGCSGPGKRPTKSNSMLPERKYWTVFLPKTALSGSTNPGANAVSSVSAPPAKVVP